MSGTSHRRVWREAGHQERMNSPLENRKVRLRGL
jgi:hypothetical protein